MRTRKRHTPEQVVRKLTEADRLLAEGKDVADVCRALQVSEATYHRWRNQFGGLKADDAKRLKSSVACVKDLGQFLGWLLRRDWALVVGEHFGRGAVAQR